MKHQVNAVITLMIKKRTQDGLSLRGLSEKIGVSFSSLARIERGEGSPDHNTQARILNWLGDMAKDAGIDFQRTAQVHFRASKNVDGATVKHLLEVAELIKDEFGESDGA